MRPVGVVEAVDDRSDEIARDFPELGHGVQGKRMRRRVISQRYMSGSIAQVWVGWELVRAAVPHGGGVGACGERLGNGCPRPWRARWGRDRRRCLVLPSFWVENLVKRRGDSLAFPTKPSTGILGMRLRLTRE